MDSIDLIARENEFKKLNKQLEKKTESLMKEIEHVMQKQDIYPDFSSLKRTPSPKNFKTHSCDSRKTLTAHSRDSGRDIMTYCSKITSNKAKRTVKNGLKMICDSSTKKEEQNNCDSNTQSNYKSSDQVMCQNCMFDENRRLSDDSEFIYAFVSINVNEKIMPETFLKERVTVERVCKFLLAKVKLMQEQLHKNQSTLDTKTRQCEGHLTQLAELESEKLSLLNRVNSMRADTADVRAKYAVLQNKLEEKERLYKEVRSANDRLAAEVKQTRSRSGGLEARCAAHQHAADTLRQQLETARVSQKEFHESSRALSTSHQSAICRLEARVKDLMACIDKQNSLIDNLKRQNTLLAAECNLKSLEKEYTEFLDQDF